MFSFTDFQLKELIDILQEAGLQYTGSTTEPFDDEIKISDRRVVNWLVHFGLVSKKGQISRSQVPGHGDGTQIKKVIEGAKAKKLVPIHTERRKGYHKMWHPNVKVVKLNGNLELK